MLAARVEPKNAPQESEKTDNFKPLVFREFQAGVGTAGAALQVKGRSKARGARQVFAGDLTPSKTSSLAAKTWSARKTASNI